MAKTRILIVEDERITATDIEDILLNLGYDVTDLVATGKEAILKAEQTKPNLVLMDIRIKGPMDGVDAAREIRERFNVPVIYLTAHADRETLARAKQASPLGYIVKPFQEAELQAVIEVALHKHKLDVAARDREDQLSATLGAMGEGVICVDTMGAVTYLNAAAEEWTGWKQADALHKDLPEIFKLLGQDDRRLIEGIGKRALREGIIEELPESVVLLAKNGMEHPIGGTAAPIRDHLGRVSGAVVAFGEGRAVESADGTPAAPSVPVGEGFRAGKLEMVVESPAMKELMKFSARIAASGVSAILLQGDSGTGKDVLARFMHENSKRREQPFVSINCAAIPETLLESELFGYEKGAFTDARAQKKGVIELAHGGTVFLDEIGELPLNLQAKLLRVLEEQVFRRLGGVREVTVDIRVITATNKNLGEAVHNRQFREDLFYRLNVIQIAIPPLRDHREDVLPLAYYFIKLYNRKFEREIEGLSPQATQILLAHHWPGNVRELRNAIERAMVLEESPRLEAQSLTILTESFAPATPIPPMAAAATQGRSLEDVERSMLHQALEEAGGNQSQAARRLGISRDTLRYRIKKFDLK